MKSLRHLLDDSKNKKSILLKRRMNSPIRSTFYFLLLVLFTLYSIFASDIRVAASTKSKDIVWDVFTIITILFFAFDICLSFIYSQKWFKSVGFYFEVASCLSLILDLTFLWENALLDDWLKGLNVLPVLELTVLRSNRMRTFVWVMSFVRFIRFSLFMVLFDGVTERNDFREDQELIEKRKSIATGNQKAGLQNPDNRDLSVKDRVLKYPTIDFDFEMQSEIEGFKRVDVGDIEVHNTSRSFTYQNTKRAMYGNIALMILMPLFLFQTFYNRLSPGPCSVSNQLHYVSQNNLLTGTSYSEFLDKMVAKPVDSTHSVPLSVSLFQFNNKGVTTTDRVVQVNSTLDSSNKPKKNLTVSQPEDEVEYMRTHRPFEYLVYLTPSDTSKLVDGDKFVFTIYDMRKEAVYDAGISIARTAVILVVFLLTVFLFLNDSKKLLLGPFADMMKRIKNIEENPMTAAREMEIEFGEQEKLAERNSSFRRELAELRRYETNVLTNTLAKSGQLLALGFGEAGINLIMEKLKKGSEMVGKKVICLYGFADIKMFTEVSEKLKEDVITFINEIANILSPIIDYHTGGTNKNLGEAFLFVWRFREQDTTIVWDYDPDGNLRQNVKLKEFADKNNLITSRCDLALLSFIKCIIQVYQAPNMNKYKTDPRLASIPNFKVKNSFGLHIGWGIEGAIGSEYKIDASYLSPNVNLASRVQYATKQFGVHVLISGMVYDLLSKEIQMLMREIDCVELKGSKLAMHLWTYDMDLGCLDAKYAKEMKEETRQLYQKVVKERMIEYRKRVKQFHEDFYSSKIIGKDCFLYDTDVIRVHKKFEEKFYESWNTGYRLYIEGKWGEAAPYFERTLDMLPNYHDKPSEVILSFLKAANYEKPSYWKGVRKLMNK